MNRHKILLIDDDIDLSMTIKRSLESVGGYEVVVESDPRNGVSAALTHSPDLILLDVIMPYKDGGEVASEIREEPGMIDVKILFLTSIVDKNEAALKGGKIGEDPVIAKPVSAEELISAISKIL